MVFLFTQAVFPDHLQTMSDLASALLMCGASGSGCDSDVSWELLSPSGSTHLAQL